MDDEGSLGHRASAGRGSIGTADPGHKESLEAEGLPQVGEVEEEGGTAREVEALPSPS